MNEVKKEIIAKDLEPAIFELEVGDDVYKLELNNQAVKKADDMHIINTLKDNGITDILANMIFLYGLKNYNMSLIKAKKIAETIVDEKQYDVSELASELIDEFVARFNQVFISTGAKKKLKRA